MRYVVTLAGRTFEVELGAHGTTVDGRVVDAGLARVEGTDTRSLVLDGESYRILARRDGRDAWDMHLRGRRYRVGVVDERTHAIRQMTGAAAAATGPRPVRAPMPGLVVKIEVEEGDLVQAGQGVAIVEAMKMENELKAESAGVVRRVHVAAGEAVDKDQILIELEAPVDARPQEGS